MSKSIKEIAKIASEWWADKVINPKFDNGDDSMAGFLGSMLGAMATKEVNGDAKEKFMHHLSKTIEEALTTQRGQFILDVDYEPCRELSEAGEYAGISENNYPWKTTMWIEENHVSVSYGYRAETQYLYNNKEYWQEQIKRTKGSIDIYKNGNMCSWIKDEAERKVHIKEMIDSLEKNIREYEINLEKAEE